MRDDEPIEIDAGKTARAMAFSENGEFLVSGHDWGAQVWRTNDGQQVATMKTRRPVCCLAFSRDSSWIAAGIRRGEPDNLIVWDTRRKFKQVFSQDSTSCTTHAVDFSPRDLDSARLLSVSDDRSACVWDIATRQQVLLLSLKSVAIAAKYSPQGDQLVIATQESLLVYDYINRHFLADISVKVTPIFNTGLLWSTNLHLIVISDDQIKQIEASTGSIASQWPVPDSTEYSCIAQPKHGEFLVYSTGHTILFWDTSTHNRFKLVKSPQDVCSIALSPDDRFLAISGEEGKITIQSLSHIAASTSYHDVYRQDPDFREPDFQIDEAVLDLWKRDQLTNTEAAFSAAITTSCKATHDLFAGRALVRTRLREWNTALVDAQKAIKIQPSLIGYIAKSIACVGKGEKDKALRTCDIAFARFHSTHVSFLLLMKAIIVFMSGEHRDAILRVDDLIATVPTNPICYIVQAYMYFLIGTSQLESGNHKGAMQSFERARAQMRHDTSRPLFVISLISGWKFDRLGIMTRQSLCEALYNGDHIKDAVERFHQLKGELEAETMDDDQRRWSRDFCRRSCEMLVHLGDTAMDAQRHEEAISLYTTALTISPSPQSILIKRSKAFVETGSWKQVLDDANQVISLDPSSPWGYEIKHAALHKAGQYDDAVHAFEVMLSRFAQSPDPDVQQHGDQYISPSTTRATIRNIVQRTLRHLPRVLINTTTGRLHDKSEQVSAFESLPIFNELVSSTTTRINYARIKREVRQYFRYVMFSHKWEDNEPLFQLVVRTAVYDLKKSPTHDKLKTFCTIVRDGGFIWAWSDTCCINKSDHFILQEALVAMFKWYQGSALTIVFLRGVRSLAQLGALMGSIWNTRAWTLQEYIASNVIHFYTEDWTLYLNLQLPNHKDSSEIISEMEQSTGISAMQLIALRPGLTSIREKLRLASTRQTTLVEDAAYSLLGIFSVTGLPAIYGEGEGSLGRLLAHVLAGSGDVSVLAWSGDSGSFNSCLPAHITVFGRPARLHLPLPLPEAEMERIVSASHTSSFDLDVAMTLYDRLGDLPAPWFAASRMKLPCIAFQLPSLSSDYRTRAERVYRVDSPAFGSVEIRTRHDLSRMKHFYLIHPWLDALLEPEDIHNNILAEDDGPQPLSPNGDDDLDDDFDEEIDDSDPSSVPEPHLLSHPAVAHTVPDIPLDKEMCARRFLARLRQPFGALLVTPTGTGRRATPDYRRVAADSLITVRFQENLSLGEILDNVRTLDVL